MKNIAYILIFTIVSFVGCSGTTKKEDNLPEPKNISIIRFDKDVYKYLQQPDVEKEQLLKDKYPLLLPAFGRIAMNENDPSVLFSSMKEYFSHPMLMQIYKDALNVFDDVTLYEEELSEANVLISQHFADKALPQLAMHVSGFKENVIILNNLISISSDKYLGGNYAAYQGFFQPFERQQMQSQYLVRDYLKAWLMSDAVKSDADDSKNLLAAMISEGKVLYALSVLLPKQGENGLIGYTTEQSAWCKENEKTVWQTIVKQNHLYSTDHMIVTRYINDAPNTSTVSPQSPGCIGCWVGWQIVNHYAKKKGVSLQNIIDTDAQTILKDAKYNP